MTIKPIDISVSPGSLVTITIPELYLTKGKVNSLLFCLTKPQYVKFKTVTGIERVVIQNGLGGTSYILEDYAGDTFFADRLISGYEYRLRFGNNGPTAPSGTGSLPHFININTPCCSKGYGPVGSGAAATPAGA